MSAEKTAITPTRTEDFPEWYQQVIKAADLAENSETRGCMVIKPWGYGIWELIQQQLDRKFKATGHQNAYFPLLIPLSYLEKEAEHAEGFAGVVEFVVGHGNGFGPRDPHGECRLAVAGVRGVVCTTEHHLLRLMVVNVDGLSRSRQQLLNGVIKLKVGRF